MPEENTQYSECVRCARCGLHGAIPTSNRRNDMAWLKGKKTIIGALAGGVLVVLHSLGDVIKMLIPVPAVDVVPDGG